MTCICYPFVEGKFLDETTARCPVALFPLRLERDLKGRPRWKLTSLSDEPVLLNRTFFLAYERFQQLRLPAEIWETDWSEARTGANGSMPCTSLSSNTK
ncbi:MAG: hypothetical protein R3B47_18505 [Bacteroidia bacterium]